MLQTQAKSPGTTHVIHVTSRFKFDAFLPFLACVAGVERGAPATQAIPFSTVHNKTIRIRFRFGPLSKEFSSRCLFHENAKRTTCISVNRRGKRIEMYALSNEKVSVGPKKRLSRRLQ